MRTRKLPALDRPGGCEAHPEAGGVSVVPCDSSRQTHVQERHAGIIVDLRGNGPIGDPLADLGLRSRPGRPRLPAGTRVSGSDLLTQGMASQPGRDGELYGQKAACR